jgi:molybdenum cofactor biosynthesis enzyme MoaA
MKKILEDLTNVDMKVYPTYACNSNCPFCMTDLRWKSSETSTEDFLRNFKKAFEMYFGAGGRKVLITGGEPTNALDKVIGILQIISGYALDLSVIYTNGANLLKKTKNKEVREEATTEEVTIMDYLVREGLKNFNISLHHYDASRRKELSDESCEDIEKICQKAALLGATIRLNCTVMRDYIGNAEEMMKYIQWAQERGIRDIYFRDLFRLANRERSCAYANIEKLSFTDAQRVDFDMLILQMVSVYDGGLSIKKVMDRHKRNGRTFIFDYHGAKISFGSLVVGSEKEDEFTYFNVQPDGQVYRDMNGPASRLIM